MALSSIYGFEEQRRLLEEQKRAVLREMSSMTGIIRSYDDPYGDGLEQKQAVVKEDPKPEPDKRLLLLGDVK